MLKGKRNFYIGNILYFLGITLFLLNVGSGYHYLSLLSSTILCILVVGAALLLIQKNKDVTSFMNTIKFQLIMASFYLFIAVLVGIKVGDFVLAFLLLLMLISNIQIDMREKKKAEIQS